VRAVGIVVGKNFERPAQDFFVVAALMLTPLPSRRLSRTRRDD
jgi:hypothetical protein